MRKFYFKYSLFLIIISGCEKSKVLVPSYIQIDAISLSADNATQGSSSSKFTDCVVSVAGQSYGTFELPAKFPVTKTGNNTIEVNAGIKLNGANSSRESPAVFLAYKVDTNLTEAGVVKLKPVVKYGSFVTFAWLEGFETNGLNISPYSTSKNLSITSDPNKVFEGSKSAIFQLSDSVDAYSCMSTNKYTLPKAGTSIYLELNYSCSTNLAVGLVVNTSATSSFTKQVIYLKPTTSYASQPRWNKIYISLTEGVSSETTAKEFNILFSCNKQSGVSYDEVLIDNIKLLY